MDELRTHLEASKRSIFPPTELNEVLLMVYNIIRRAVLEECDTLQLTPTHFVWSKQGVPVGTFPINQVKPSVSFRDMLLKIVARDPIVQRHLQLVAETTDELTYRLQDVPVAHAV